MNISEMKIFEANHSTKIIFLDAAVDGCGWGLAMSRTIRPVLMIFVFQINCPHIYFLPHVFVIIVIIIQCACVNFVDL